MVGITNQKDAESNTDVDNLEFLASNLNPKYHLLSLTISLVRITYKDLIK